VPWLLDTDACVQLLNNTSPALVTRLLAEKPRSVFLSAITVAELSFGAEKSARRAENHDKIEKFCAVFEVLPFETAVCSAYARLRLALERAGTPVGPMDMLIAATALAHGLTVVTSNEREFRRIEGLAVENWALGPTLVCDKSTRAAKRKPVRRPSRYPTRTKR